MPLTFLIDFHQVYARPKAYLSIKIKNGPGPPSSTWIRIGRQCVPFHFLECDAFTILT